MRRIRTGAAIVLACAATLSTAPSRATTTITKEAVSFTVTNPLDPGKTYTVNGVLTRPEGCVSNVLLALHGLSYGAWAWDFRDVDPARYSVADALAARGYALLAIDELGYNTSEGTGSPDHPNGYTLTVESYAYMTGQILRQLHAGTYTAAHPNAFTHVGLIGHSAGSEIVEEAAALYPSLVDVLIPTAYTHVPYVSNSWLLREWIPGDNVRAAESDYEYFETNPTIRKHDMYDLANADPTVVADDNRRAALTPSGEIWSIGLQPSHLLMLKINVPVLLVLADKDALFPGTHAAQELALFASAKDRTAVRLPHDGHVFFLQLDAPAAQRVIANWLDKHQHAMPRC
jgi:pimeloyl-ACP methyl ester carboxylesterase